jgi:hypothetical protein
VTGQGDVPAIGTEQGVERTVRDVMQDKSYGYLHVQTGPGDGRPPKGRGWLQRLLDRLRGR